MKPRLLFSLLAICLISHTYGQIVEDFDGNSYNTIVIGSQLWMQENLKSVHFANGDPIPTSVDPVNNVFESIYQWSYEDDSSFVPDYGRLYSWYTTIDDRNICPAGWHVPSDSEWTVLSEFLGGSGIAGGLMKEMGTEHWNVTDASVTNSSQFTALPGGFRGNPTGFTNLGNMGLFWTSTPWGSLAFPRGYVYKLQASNGTLEQSIAVANCGLSVRCIEGNPQTSMPENSPDILALYPNPVSDQLTIQFPKPDIYQLIIRDTAGRTVLEKTLTDLTSIIPMGHVVNGVYSITITGLNLHFQDLLFVN